MMLIVFNKRFYVPNMMNRKSTSFFTRVCACVPDDQIPTTTFINDPMSFSLVQLSSLEILGSVDWIETILQSMWRCFVQYLALADVRVGMKSA
jgi:hypothetical protein